MRDAAAIDHRIEIEDLRIRRMETHQRLQRTGIELVAVFGGVEQLAVQVPVDDACCKLADLADIGPEHLPASLFRQPLGNGDNRDENGSRHEARNAEDAGVEAPIGIGGTSGACMFGQGASYSLILVFPAPRRLAKLP